MIQLKALGIVHNDRKTPEDDFWGDVVSIIILDPNIFDTTATQGLEGYSHIEVVFYMHQVLDEKIECGARHPRNLLHLPETGILAQRGKNRPNKLGVSRAKILDVTGLTLHVQGLDAIDDTPVLDIKPYTKTFVPLAEEVKEPKWLSEEIMMNYYKPQSSS